MKARKRFKKGAVITTEKTVAAFDQICVKYIIPCFCHPLTANVIPTRAGSRCEIKKCKVTNAASVRRKFISVNQRRLAVKSNSPIRPANAERGRRRGAASLPKSRSANKRAERFSLRPAFPNHIFTSPCG